MALIIKLSFVWLLHLAFFAAYPETGPFGGYYLAVSLLLWTGFTLFLTTAVKLVRFFNGALGAALNLAVFFLMALSIGFTMPQQDKTSVLEKIQKGYYPDRNTLNKGMRRFGINLDKEINGKLKNLEAEANKAVKKLKKD